MPLREGEVGKKAALKRIHKKQKWNVFKRLKQWARKMDRRFSRIF